MKLLFGAETPSENKATPPYRDGAYQGDKNPLEHDPYANPLEGYGNNPAAEVLDPENFYNVEGFDKEVYQSEEEKVIDDSQIGGEVGKMMEKYGMEEWELEALLKKCEDYLNGTSKVPPRSNLAEVQELALFYREYLRTKNEAGLPLSETEAAKLSEKELDELADLYQERNYLAFLVANANEAPVEEKIIDEKLLDSNVKLRYSTEKGNNAPKESPHYAEELAAADKKIAILEGKAFKDEKKKEVVKNIPKYSEEEKALQTSCLNYLGHRSGKPSFAKGGPVLNINQILELAREGAEENGWPKGKFFAETFKGKRQLSRIVSFGGKRIKYVFLSEKLPVGEYYFEANPNKFFISRNNPDSAVAPITTMVNMEDLPEKQPADNLEKRA